MEGYAIQARSLKISFNGVKVLHEVDFDLRVGEIHALIGQNGAGKSTLVKIFNGVYQKDSGTISVFGKAQEYDTPQAANQAGIAMVYQDLSLVPSLTITENVFLFRHPFRKGIFLDDKRALKEAQKLFALIGVQHGMNLHDPVEEISVGEQQLVEIAKALSLKPRILILDEPTASLSNAEIQVLFTAIKNLKSQGISIIYITHYLKDIFKICDSVTVLRDGKRVCTRPVGDTSVQELVRAMVGEQAEVIQEWSKKEEYRHQRPLLELRRASTPYLKDISLRVYPGEIVGIAGLLGSGRSELLKAIFGLDRISAGEILINGEFVSIQSPRDAIRSGIALLPEDRRKKGLILDFSVGSNIILPILRDLKGKLFLDGRKSDRVVEHFIKYLKVKTQGKEQKVKYLSGGNQQKIVVAKCLASNSHILLLDDPTFGVDVQAKQEIMKIVKEYVSQGNGVIFVSSEFNEIASFCDRVYVLRKGSLSLCTDRVKINEDALLQQVQ